MPLAQGTQLGPYEVVGPLGAGGMGEVYRARDSRLGRVVAVKILPEEFAQDPARPVSRPFVAWKGWTAACGSNGAMRMS